MAGHSHWAGIKFKKGIADAKRGRLFSRLAKAIIVAARDGGSSPDMNLKLRYAIDKAKEASMPKENIERAIKRGTGELAGGALDSVVYEGYGPGGVAVLCDLLTDNRNRTAGEIRKTFEVHGGKLGSTGCVAWMFTAKGLLTVRTEDVNEDDLLEVVLEAGGEDMKREGDIFEIVCAPGAFQALRAALHEHRIASEVAEITQMPSTTVDVEGETAHRVLKLVAALEDHDDIQQVYANFNVPDEVMAAAMSE